MDKNNPGRKYLSGNNLQWIKLIQCVNQLAMDQIDPRQVVPRQVFTSLFHGKLFSDRYMYLLPMTGY